MEQIKDLSKCVELIQKLKDTSILLTLKNLSAFIKDNFLCFRLNKNDYAIYEIPHIKPVCTIILKPGEEEFEITEDFFVNYTLDKIEAYKNLDRFELTLEKPNLYMIRTCALDKTVDKELSAKDTKLLKSLIEKNKRSYICKLKHWLKYNPEELSFYHEA